MKTIEELQKMVDFAKPHASDSIQGAMRRLADAQLELMQEMLERIALLDEKIAEQPGRTTR